MPQHASPHQPPTHRSIAACASAAHIATLAAWLALASTSAHAARPLNTDDANIVDAKSCQLESWTRRTSHGTELWAIPGCNPWGGTEFSVGAGRQTDQVAGGAGFRVLQVKARLLPVTPQSAGLALTLGTTRFSGDATSPAQRDTYINLPFTAPLGHDRYLHLNAGWVRHHSSATSRLTWGVGTELPLSERIIAVAETYGEQGTQAKAQVGLRFWVVPQRVQIDTTLGNSLSAPRDRWLSIGLRLLSPAFLP